MAYNVLETQCVRSELIGALRCIEDVPCEPTAAAELAAKYIEFVENVGRFPEMYPQVHESSLRAKGHRKATLKNYLVLYRCEGDTAYVMHLFHQSQDYARLV